MGRRQPGARTEPADRVAVRELSEGATAFTLVAPFYAAIVAKLFMSILAGRVLYQIWQSKKWSKPMRGARICDMAGAQRPERPRPAMQLLARSLPFGFAP